MRGVCQRLEFGEDPAHHEDAKEFCLLLVLLDSLPPIGAAEDVEAEACAKPAHKPLI